MLYEDYGFGVVVVGAEQDFGGVSPKSAGGWRPFRRWCLSVPRIKSGVLVPYTNFTSSRSFIPLGYRKFIIPKTPSLTHAMHPPH